MREKRQQKNWGPRGRNAAAFQALLDALAECGAKPSYDYQRIIICLGTGPGVLGSLVRRRGAFVIGPSGPLESNRDFGFLVVKNAENCTQAMLQSIVLFVNRTRGVVVLLATAESVGKWHDRWRIQADQIRRRTHIVIEFSAIFPP